MSIRSLAAGFVCFAYLVGCSGSSSSPSDGTTEAASDSVNGSTGGKTSGDTGGGSGSSTGGDSTTGGSTGEKDTTDTSGSTGDTGTTGGTGGSTGETDTTGTTDGGTTDTTEAGTTDTTDAGTTDSTGSTDTDGTTDTGGSTTLGETDTGANTETDTGGGAPDAPVLELEFSPIKQFDFSWAAIPGATYYQLLERPQPGAEFAVLEAELLGEQVSVTMPLHFRWSASYILRACNDDGCTDSAEVDVVDSLASAVGYFKASNTDASDYFGVAIALSADGNTLTAGAIKESSNATGIDGNQANDGAQEAGAVYVFTRTNDVWSQQAYIKASNTNAGDYFGTSVALSANGNTLVVGAFGESSKAKGINGDQLNNSSAESGAVYVFTRTNDVWSQQAYIKASNTGTDDSFGISVALSEDGNTLAVGAYTESSNATGINGNQTNNKATYAGAVYVFTRTNNVWSQQAYIKASNTDTANYFGFGAVLSADGNTLAVSAGGESSAAIGINGNQTNNSAAFAGAVYLFTRQTNVWSQQAYIKAPNTDAKDYFGWGAVALSGDGNTLAVGATGESSAATGIGGDQTNNNKIDSGAVYLY